MERKLLYVNQGFNGGLNFRGWQSWLFVKAMCTCDRKDDLNGDDVKELKDIDIRWLIYIGVEVTEKDGKNYWED